MGRENIVFEMIIWHSNPCNIHRLRKMTETRIFKTSTLDSIFIHKNSGLPRLNMIRVTGSLRLNSFSELCTHITEKLRYPTAQQQKMETFAFTLSHFEVSDRTIIQTNGSKFSRRGTWRVGEAEEDELTAFYCDVDNANDEQTIVSLQEIANRLDALGLSWFAYTSYSHSLAKPKFRVIIDTTRAVDRAKMLKLAVYLDWRVFGRQLDMSIYDPADCLFAPPHQCEIASSLDGQPLDVDQTLADLPSLQIASPECWERVIKRQQPIQRVREAKSPSAATLASVDLSVRAEVSIDNHQFFNPAWETLYRDRVAGGHWETMRSLIGMIWVKTRGTLTHGEMRKLMGEIDATADNYFIRHHGEAKATELIAFVMSCAVPQLDDDRCSLIEQEEAGLTILVKDAECGQGKTRDELCRIVRERGRHVFAVDKIENIEKRKKELFKQAGKDFVRFIIHEAHSQNNLRVPLQLVNLRKDIDKLRASSSIVVFVTQQSMAQMDWSDWSDFEAIIDEVPECFHLFSLQVGQHADLLRRHLKVVGVDGNCYALAPTEEGLVLARRTDIDDYDKVHHGLCVMLAKPNNRVWVRQTHWDKAEDGGKLDFFALCSPLNLLPFKDVRLLGDEAMKSITIRAWQEKWGVEFESLDFPRRDRRVPTSKRITIKYVSDHRDSSITRFKEGDMPLEKLTEWIKQDAGGEPVLWTADERLKAKSCLASCDYIPPKSHGRNDLDHYRRVAWLAAMKASKFEITTLRQICGMTAQELVDWREFNAMYQFVMRGIIRDFDSDAPMTIYVFSRQQAEYLHRRLGGVVEKIADIVLDRPARCHDEEGAMTAAERQKVRYWRAKMMEAGVTDVRALPKGEKLSAREVRLINRAC